MLKTEEGQNNAVFACFGSAAQHGQYFEKALGEFITTIRLELKPSIQLEDMQSFKKSIYKKTIGQLLKIVGKYVKTDANWVTDSWVKAHESRNFLIHRYFLEREDRFKTKSGRMAMMVELVKIETQIKKATDLINGMRVAVTEQIMSNDSEQRKSDRALFSIEIIVDGDHG